MFAGRGVFVANECLLAGIQKRGGNYKFIYIIIYCGYFKELSQVLFFPVDTLHPSQQFFRHD